MLAMPQYMNMFSHVPLSPPEDQQSTHASLARVSGGRTSASSFPTDNNHVDSMTQPPPGLKHETNKQSSRSSSGSSPKKYGKVVRLRKACDPCSLRKVRCDQEQPCRPCRSLDIPCTFERPSRRRGPPNRLAQALKREHEAHQLVNAHSPQLSPTGDHRTRSETTPLSAESIGPLDLIRHLVDDYFTFLHPLQPFPHEPSFREAFDKRRDLHDGCFLALLAAMVGTLVAAYPRKARQRLNNLGDRRAFSSAFDLVTHCQNVATQARGSDYLQKEDLCSNDAATSYCFVVMFAYTYRWNKASIYFGECNNIVRCLLAQRAGGSPDATDVPEVDLIEHEMTKRLFWTIFVSVRSTAAFSASLADVSINPPTATHQYPPLAVELDDAYIHATHYEAQPSILPSWMAGFNANVNIYMTHDPLVAMENSYGVDQLFDPDRQRNTIYNCDLNVKKCVQGLPEVLSIWSGPPSRSPSASHASVLRPNSDDVVRGSSDHLLQSFKVACEIQKANLYVSYLSSRSYFVEKYYNLCEPLRAYTADQFSSSTGHTVNEMRLWIRSERQNIASDLLHVLCSIRPIHFEPNGASLTMKVRQIASTLLPEAAPPQSPDEWSPQNLMLPADGVSAYYVRQFMDILVDLERGAKQPDDGEEGLEGEEVEVDEEMDLRRWANLREHQRAFARSGGAAIGPS